VATNYSPKIVTDGLVLCLDAANPKSYPGSGTTWKDLSKREITTTKEGSSAPTYPQFSSNFNGYFEFIDGPNGDNKNRFDAAVPQMAQTTAMAIWRARNTGHVFRMSNSDLQIGPDGFTAGDSFADIRVLRGDAVIANNEWEIGALTFDGQTLKAYKKGELLAQKTRSAPTDISAGTLRIGARNDAFAAHFEGDISCVLVYEKVLTDSEIKQNFNALRGRYGI